MKSSIKPSDIRYDENLFQHDNESRICMLYLLVIELSKATIFEIPWLNTQ